MTRQWENDSYVKAWRRSASSSFTPVHYCGRWSWLHIDRQPHRRDDDRKWKSEQVNDSPAITAPALGAPQTQRPCVNYSSRTPTPSGGWRRSKQFKKRGSGNWRGTGSSCAFNKSAERVTFWWLFGTSCTVCFVLVDLKWKCQSVSCQRWWICLCPVALNVNTLILRLCIKHPAKHLR